MSEFTKFEIVTFVLLAWSSALLGCSIGLG